MLRLGFIIFAAFYVATCLPIDNNQSILINRLQRSAEDCGPNGHPHPPFWPPPPPFWPPGPPPPWHHRFGNNWGPGPQNFPHSQDIRQDNEDDFGKLPCDNCNSNAAISNSKSDSGDAISIAISRSGKPKT